MLKAYAWKLPFNCSCGSISLGHSLVKNYSVYELFWPVIVAQVLICLTTLVSGLENLDLYCLMDQRNLLLSVVSKGSVVEVKQLWIILLQGWILVLMEDCFFTWMQQGQLIWQDHSRQSSCSFHISIWPGWGCYHRENGSWLGSHHS